MARAGGPRCKGRQPRSARPARARQPCPSSPALRAQVAAAGGARGGADAPAAAQAALEAHQRGVARWEARVARQLEKIVALQRGARTPGGASAGATPRGGAPSGAPAVKSRDPARTGPP
jgi:hypothetical protein